LLRRAEAHPIQTPGSWISSRLGLESYHHFHPATPHLDLGRWRMSPFGFPLAGCYRIHDPYTLLLLIHADQYVEERTSHLIMVLIKAGNAGQQLYLIFLLVLLPGCLIGHLGCCTWP